MHVKITQNLQRLLKLASNLRDMRPLYDRIGEYMVTSVIKNFEQEGRPNRWRPLAWATLYGRYARKGRKAFTRKGAFTVGFQRHLEGHKILQRKGRLRNDIRAQAYSDRVEIGTSGIPYARIHQYGGWAGRRNRRVYIYRRPYLLMQIEDRVLIRTMSRQHVLGGQ